MGIKIPKDKTYTKNKSVAATLKWNVRLGDKLTGLYGVGSPLQKYIDRTVLDGCRRYIPFDQGALMRSGDLGTVIGTGYVRWVAPYARYLYYGNLMVGVNSRSAYAKRHEKKEVVKPEIPLKYGHGRGPRWFETWKSNDLKSLMAGIKEKFGMETEVY